MTKDLALITTLENPTVLNSRDFILAVREELEKTARVLLSRIRLKKEREKRIWEIFFQILFRWRRRTSGQLFPAGVELFQFLGDLLFFAAQLQAFCHIRTDLRQDQRFIDFLIRVSRSSMRCSVFFSSFSSFRCRACSFF